MSIPDTFHFDNRGEVIQNHGFRPYFITIVILLVALLSFGVGRLSGSKSPGVVIDYDPNLLKASPTSNVASDSLEASVTASSQGTRYYFSHCANNISEKNKISFATPALAEKAGYTLALNCRPK